MKIKHSMKSILAAIAAGLVLTGSAFAATTDFPAPLPGFKSDSELAEWRSDLIAKAEAEEAVAIAARETSQVFYTGKPFVEETGEYAFMYRNYNPEFARWSSHDPSGFPDGANNLAYMAVPTIQFDWQGLDVVTIQKIWGSYTTITINNFGVIAGGAGTIAAVLAGLPSAGATVAVVVAGLATVGASVTVGDPVGPSLMDEQTADLENPIFKKFEVAHDSSYSYDLGILTTGITITTITTVDYIYE